MKRTKALTSLSHDHHRALVTAKRIKDMKQRSEDEITEYWLAKREVIFSELQQHFYEEEERLLPLLNDDSKEMGQRLLWDHHTMLRLLKSTEADDALLFSQILKDHVRFEERELFPWLEAMYDESALSTVFQ